MTSEDPKRLLAELEIARLSLRAREKPSRRLGLMLAALVVMIVGGLILWLLAIMAGAVAPEKKTSPGGSLSWHDKRFAPAALRL